MRLWPWPKRKDLKSIHDYDALRDLLCDQMRMGFWTVFPHDNDTASPKAQWWLSKEYRRLRSLFNDHEGPEPIDVKSWASRVHPDDRMKLVTSFRSYIKDPSPKKPFLTTYRLIQPDDSYRWYHSMGVSRHLASGLTERFDGVLVDAHDAICQTERLDILDSHAGVGLWDIRFFDSDIWHERTEFQFSAAFRRIFGYDANDPLFPNSRDTLINLLHPDEAEDVIAQMKALISRERPDKWDLIHRFKHKTDGYRWVRSIGGVLRDCNEHSLRACGSVIDIHDSKMAELRMTEQIALQNEVSTMAHRLGTMVSQDSARAARDVKSVLESTENLALSTIGFRDLIQDAAEACAKSSRDAATTAAVVGHLVNSVNRIGDLLKMIGGFATQTNLLALNATIEAVRAGEAGRGFVVVANEVKDLARASTQATDEISSQLAAMMEEAKRASAAIYNISDATNNARRLADDVVEAIANHETATRGIAEKVASLAAEASSVSSTIENVAGEIQVRIAKVRRNEDKQIHRHA